MKYLKLKKAILAVCLTAGIQQVYAQQSFLIEGQLGKQWQGKVRLMYTDNGKSFTDSVALKDGQFRFEVPALSMPTIALLRIPGYGDKPMDTVPTEQRGLFLENENVRITGNDGLFTATIQAGPIERDYLILETAYKPLFLESIEMNKRILKARQTHDEVAMAQVSTDFKQFNRKREILDSAFIADHPQSYAAFDMWYHGLPPAIDPSVQQDFDRFAAPLHQTVRGKMLQQRIDDARVLDAGMPAPEIALRDTLGNLQSLSAQRGKYVLLYFYNFYQGASDIFGYNISRTGRRLANKNLVLYGVYYDNNIYNSNRIPYWKSVVNHYRFSGIQVEDIDGGGGFDDGYYSQAAKAWGLDKIHFLPMAYLIGPDGKILMRNLNVNSDNLFIQISNAIK